jgi:transposase InsO family protein
MKHFLARAFIELTRLLAGAYAAVMAKKRGRALDLAGLRDLVERQQVEIELLRARLSRLDSAKRPRYRPQERLRILLYKAKWPSSLAELARRFVLSVETIKEWIVEVDAGVEKRVKPKAPVNQLPDAVREIAILLRWQQLAWGAKRIADVIRRMKLKMSRTSVQRILRRNPRKPAVIAKKAKPRNSTVVAKREHHVWLIDLTTVKSFFGIIRHRVAAVIDAYTRAVVATGVCPSEPTAAWICALVSRAIRDANAKPVHLISDHGPQFTSLEFKRLLRRRGIKHRYGAVGRHGSIAIIERFWRTLKRETLDATSSWLTVGALAEQVARFSDWFNRIRPHQGLQGRTPVDVTKAKRLKPMAITRTDVLFVSRRDLHDDPKLPVYSLRVRKAA